MERHAACGQAAPRLEERGGVELAATLGHAERAPDADERFFALKRMGTDWVGQPTLDPARNTGVDVSASWQRQGLLVSASLYANRVDGYISVVPAARANVVTGVMNTSARTWANVDAQLRGGELAAVVPLAGRLFLSGDLSYVRGTKDTNPAAGITDADLAEMPPLRGRTALRFDDGRFYAVAEGVFSASQRHVDSALKEEATGGWGVANVLAGLRHRRARGDRWASPTCSTAATSSTSRTSAIPTARASACRSRDGACSRTPRSASDVRENGRRGVRPRAGPPTRSHSPPPAC